MFTIHFSNKFQALRDHLLEATASPSASTFSPTEIIVPSAAIQRKIELSMAEQFGICANVRFSYLGQWVWQQLGKIWPVPSVSPFAPETLAWRILKILDNRTFVLAHSRLRSWMASADPVMRYELAMEIASLVDQVITYRPNLIEAWSSNKHICIPGGTRTSGQDQQWQAELWRRILHETGSDRHLSAMAKKLESLDDKAIAPLRQNGITHIFCPPTIAPLTINMLNRFSQWMDLRLYVLNPCREYWFDIVDRKRLSYLASAGKADHHETGNQLLASWGKQTQAMIDLLFDNTALTCQEEHSFTSNAEGGKTSLLAQVQDAILDLQDLPPSGITVDQNDRSIEVHVCHSLTRELEVLQDQLLALFAGENPPLPDEVLVVTPNLKDAAPLIDAVFGTASPARSIPYTITGLGNTQSNPVALALLDLLSLAASRFTASAVFKLLQQPLVSQRFQLNEAQLMDIHRWITESGIRWGMDGAHRREMQLPDDARYTFRDGLHRLFLGYALPAACTMPFASRLPAGDIEGTDAIILGRFQQFVSQLDILRQTLHRERNASEWRSCLLDLLETFTAPHGNQLDEAHEVQTRIRELCENIQQGAGDYPISRDVILRALREALDDPARGGVPTGTVTFTSMSSLRNLPYRIICAIGINDRAFPTTQAASEFDLIAHAPKRGDRQRRHDERNIFLDLLLAAQDRFYLSYTGRSIRDNSEMPPSVLISDFLDYLTPAIGEAARKRLVLEHPLQAFSTRYYQQGIDTRMNSSNETFLQALLLRQATHAQYRNTAPLNETASALDDDSDDEGNENEAGAANAFVSPFFTAPLPAPEATWRMITLDQLLQFFSNPSRYLLRQRMGIRFSEAQDELADEEPFLPDYDERRALSNRLLPLFLKGLPFDHIRQAALSGTEYPPGIVGEALLEKELRAMEMFASQIQEANAAPCLSPQTCTLSFTINEETWELTHRFNDLRPTGLLRYRFDDVRARDYLEGWITHLFLNAAELHETSSPIARETLWHSRDGKYVLHPVPDAYAQLHALISLYRQGLCEPLHFYPRSSWEYISSHHNPYKAEARWRGGRSEMSGEARDPNYRQALRAMTNPLDDAFKHCAQTVFGTMLDALSDERMG